ncbi:unnamed protein product [Aureobasidium vineae]|uniref:Uncharacterized protein n=1 Tax=Aureobasidium vineae TaxID=2773715 RepID=A0A9N8J6W8_9PEZI|nr:unnamed protein product [Aureobasidium vineae]
MADFRASLDHLKDFQANERLEIDGSAEPNEEDISENSVEEMTDREVDSGPSTNRGIQVKFQVEHR